MMQYIIGLIAARTIFEFVFRLGMTALLIRVGLYWYQNNALPPLSLLVDDAVTVWKWLESTGVVQWAQSQLQNLLGAHK